MSVVEIASLPAPSRAVHGFEVLDGRPVVAFEDEIVGFSNRESFRVNSPGLVLGLTVGPDGELHVQTESGVFELRHGAFSPPLAQLGGSGLLFRSGAQTFLELLPGEEGFAIAARRPDGRSLPVLALSGEPTTLSWNGIGMALVLDGRLEAWPAGARDMVQIAQFGALSGARDVSLVSPVAAIVALPDIVALIAPESAVTLVAMRARVRFADGFVYLLDEDAGKIFVVAGLAGLDGPQNAATRARELLGADSGDDRHAIRFAEAVRLVGCDAAVRLQEELASQEELK